MSRYWRMVKGATSVAPLLTLSINPYKTSYVGIPGSFEERTGNERMLREKYYTH